MFVTNINKILKYLGQYLNYKNSFFIVKTLYAVKIFKIVSDEHFHRSYCVFTSETTRI